MEIRTLLAAAVLVGLVGCTPKADELKTDGEPPQQNTTMQGQAAPPQGQGGVNVMPSAAGGMAPVTGTENLQGGGSGVGQAAKDRARGIGGTAPSSLNQMPSGDGE